MTTEANALAFPAFDKYHDVGEYGLTKREYFTAMAMQGYAALGLDCDSAATRAVTLADMTIEELNKRS